jgi:Ni,Fe-hydrogenase III large subunit
MKMLIGVTDTDIGEQLLALEEGSARLQPAVDGQAGHHYANYRLLKERPLKINDEPVSGSGVFRFRYGPVTAGIREAGSFNLYTFGEKILRASVDLTWKHRQSERSLENRSVREGISIAEKICSNFAMSHAVAYCRAVENALHIGVGIQAKNWRTLLLEAERVFNHLFVIYRLATAAAQKVLAAQVSALFEEALRLNECLSGSRYFLHINEIGGMRQYPSPDKIRFAILGYQQILSRFTKLYQHSLSNPNYLDRLHGSGIISRQQALHWGLTGPSLRACGIKDDLNGATEHLIGLPVITQNEGDALARMEIRSEELVNSCQYLSDHLKASDSWGEDIYEDKVPGPANGEGCGISNSPSGAIGYYVSVKESRINRAAVFTPSYVGMHAVSAALEGNVFTDFPFVLDSFGVHFTDATR